jgi:hypothetical protein
MPNTPDTSERPVSEWSITEHGVDASSYFQGHGISGTDYEYCATGIGNTPEEALSDALEQLACSGWTFTDEQERELLQDLGSEEHRTRDYVSPLEEEAISEQLSALEWSVSFRAFSGCSPEPESFEERADARKSVAETLRSRRSSGHIVRTLERGTRWEVSEPDSSWMVPDSAGSLFLESNEEEREEERERLQDLYPSELHYFVSIDVC